MYDTMADSLSHCGRYIWDDANVDDTIELLGLPHETDPFQYCSYRKEFRRSDSGKCMVASWMVEPGTMNIESFCRLPPLYHWALSRAIYEEHGRVKRSWETIASRVKELLMEAGNLLFRVALSVQ